MSVWVAGDTHADYDWHKLNTREFPEQKSLSRSDYVVILGDWGGVWDAGAQDKYIQDWYESKNFTTLWVDGNHENFDKLAQYPVTEWNGGKVQFIRENVIHLMRGQIYTIEGKKFFVMGGARSVDKDRRTEGISWWSQEIPSDEELYEGLDNLNKVDNKVDFILTHSAPTTVVQVGLGGYWMERDKVTQYLQVIAETVKYEGWYFGHYHIDKNIGRFHAKYNSKPERIV